MEIPCNQLPPGDPRLVDAIVGQLKSRGIFDKFRKECLADVDTKPAFLNLRQRVDGQVKKFLSTKAWRSDLNKNQLRDGVRKNVQESGILDTGIDAIINQVVNPKIKPFILPLVEDTVYSFLQVEKPIREIQEYDIHVQPVAVHHEEKPSFYGQHMSLPQPCQPYHPVYQEFPPEFGGHEGINILPKISSENENNSNNIEDSSVSSESEVSMDDKTEDQKPVPSQPPLMDILPMETDVISSGDDDILARASPDSSTSIQEKKMVDEGEIKMEEDNAVDSFDSARREADAMTAAVESMTLRDEKKTDSESHETHKETSVSLPFFDNKSLDSISSNTSGLSLSPTTHSKSTTVKDSQSQLKEGESPNKSLDELRSTQSTPLVDEKSLIDSVSSENSKSWIPYTLPKDLPSAERITIASFGPFGAIESARVVEGASPVSVDNSQSSVERKEEPLKESKVPKSEKSEGEITSSSSNNSSSSSTFTSPDYSKDNAAVCSSSEKDEAKVKSDPAKERHSSEGKDGERSKSKEKHGKESRRSKERDRRRSKSKSKYDDHYSHHDKDKRHRRDKDDDKDRDRHSKGHYSGNSGRATSSGDGGSKDKEKSKDKSSDHKSHSSSHSKSHSSSHSKSRSSSHSKSHSSSHSKSHSSSVSRHHDKDHKSTPKSDKRDSKSSSKHEKSSRGSREGKSSSKDSMDHKTDGKITELKATSSKSSGIKNKEKKSENAKLKPVKLVEDNIFALHLENSNKNAVLPKPVNSLVKSQKPLVPKTNSESKGVNNIANEVKDEEKSGTNVCDAAVTEKSVTKLCDVVATGESDTKLCDTLPTDLTEDKSNPKANDKVFKEANSKNLADSSNIKDEKAVTSEKTKSKEGKENKDIKNVDNEKKSIKNNDIGDVKMEDKNVNNVKDKKEKDMKVKNSENDGEKIQLVEKGNIKQSSKKLVEKKNFKNMQKKITVNGVTKSVFVSRPKRNFRDSSAGSSASDSDASESSEPVHRSKSRRIEGLLKRRGKKIKKTISPISVSSSSSDESEGEVENVTKSNDASISEPKLKKVTIPLISLKSSDLQSLTDTGDQINVTSIKPVEKIMKPITPVEKIRKTLSARKTKRIPVSINYVSEADSVLNEMFGSSSDEGTEFEGFGSTATPKKTNILPVSVSRKIDKKSKYSRTPVIRTPKIKNKRVKRLQKPKAQKGAEYVVLCDSSDSSDMEVSLVNLCSKPEQSEEPQKSNDFEGFDDEGFDESSMTGDQKLREYLSQFSFGSTVQIDDFISMDSDEEIGEESTVFFNKRNTTKSVIEEIAAKQNLESIQNAQNDEGDANNTVVVMEAAVHVTSMESYKPFKKRKLSNRTDDESVCSSPCKMPKMMLDDNEKLVTEEAIPKDVVLNTYSMLTPEEDRTSSKEYEVDLGRREASYSPLSPASDSSSDAHLKHKNESTADFLKPEICNSTEATS